MKHQIAATVGALVGLRAMPWTGTSLAITVMESRDSLGALRLCWKRSAEHLCAASIVAALLLTGV
jgi:hypothetical protein